MTPEHSIPPRRTIAPIFWLLFGAGGMLAALFGPALIIITGIMIPHGWGMPARFGSYADVLAFARNPLGKIVLFAVIPLFFWHAAERLFLTLKDMRAAPTPLLRWASYGGAALLSLFTVIVLLELGF